MKREWKVIVPRVTGDDFIYDQCLIHGIHSLNFLMRVFNCTDDPSAKNTIHHKYFRGLQVLKNTELNDEDIVIFSHNDVRFLDTFFRDKIEMIFDEKDIALLGFVGTSQLKDSGCWWDGDTKALRGHIIQGAKAKTVGEGFNLVKGLIGYFDDVVAIDGLCMITLGKYLKAGGIDFDTETYEGNHFYDLDFCMNFLSKGFKIGIADILIYHKSEGSSNQDEVWLKDRDAFINKWKSRGIEFPITSDSMETWRKNNNIETLNLIKQSKIIEIEI